jgi:ABC-type cobalt transport system substrate-binding protein
MIGIDMMKNKGILAIAFSFLVIAISFAGVVTSGKQITEDEPNLWQHPIFQTPDLKVVSIPFSQQSQLGNLIDQFIDMVDFKDSKVAAHISNIEFEWLY